jgi:hypothetical protein
MAPSKATRRKVATVTSHSRSMVLAEEPEREVHRIEEVAERDPSSERSSPTSSCPEASPGMKSAPESSSSPAASSPASLKEMFEQQGRALARWKKEDPSFVVHSVRHQYYHCDHDNDVLSASDEKTIDESDQDNDTWSGSYYSCTHHHETARTSQNADYLSVVSSRQNQQDDDFSLPSSIINLQARVNIFDVMTLHAEDDSSFCLDLEGSDSEIQNAICEIRREASQMDTLMALDQLRTFQSELAIVTRQFQARSREAEDLRVRVEQSEERAAQLELERDLHQADASKLREDLKTCIERMFDISIVAGQSVLESDDIEAHDVEDTRPQKVALLPLKQQLQQLAFGETACVGIVPNNYLPRVRRSPERSVQTRISGFSEQPGHTLRRLSMVSDPAVISVQGDSDWSECSDGAHLLASQKKGSASRNQDVFRRRGYTRSLRRPRMESMRMQRRQEAVSSSSSGPQTTPLRRHRSLSVDTNRQRPSVHMENTEREHNLCGIFSRRNKRVSMCREKDFAVMKNQIVQLHAMMKTALTASQKLRKRLATISRYYEGVIATLQDQLAEMKAEKTRTDGEFRNKLLKADLDKRVTVSRLTSELRKRDEEISILKASVDLGEV